ncbi:MULTISPECIES: ectoine/hydroxyectoine ABC transporter permease subunit EhuD [Burkholderiaceae]|uniref:ectoine/hydroxyectoine ABC transporter permease subunit EhuD n=1 Tax=Burkholderiaceae TaxID=119060 RepID=UPI001BA39748|nr:MULTISPECIES: ectoine/hydroxyectoine ABC transporter permease subunit EhuD [Burkholderiaceae]MBR8087565.1 ectoine/hydroxyectoine ABC transporter permease subunit EhuD [Burkholderia vietnamiensis]
MDWDWNYVGTILPILLRGLLVSLEATLLGAIVAGIVGLIFAILRLSPNAGAARGATIVVNFIRGTPLLVQLYFAFYILPDIGVRLPALVAGVLVFGIHYATYTAEVYRGGIENVPRGQWEAAKACNLSAKDTWLQVILPQALPPMTPALANYLLSMLKETPLLSAITVLELMNEAKIIANTDYRYFEPMTVVGVMFLAISLVAVSLIRRLEKRFAKYSG